MINVSNNIIKAFETSTTQADKIVLDGNEYRISNVEYYDDCYSDGNIFGTAIARCLDFEIENTVDLEKKEVEYFTGIQVDGVINWISLGNFIIQSVEPNDTTKINRVSAIDYMLKTNVKYNTKLNYSNATILDVLQEVCVNCGLILATNEFTNSNFKVDSNQFVEDSLCRQVIQAIAQISGTVAKIKSDNKLYLLNPNKITNVSKVFTLNNYKEAEIKRSTHPINLVSLGMADIEGENVTLRDDESIAKLGEENSLVINDNPFAYTQEKRGQLITALFNAVKGFEYKAYAFKCQGLPYLETMDKIQFLDKECNSYDSYVFRFNYKSPKGLESTIEAPSMIKATVNYQNVLSALDIAKRTEILVDKQNQTIERVVSNVDEQNNKISKMQQTVDSINSKISDIADITTSQETATGKLVFEKINQSEPIHIEIRPLGENISYLYPFEKLFPADDLFIKLRTLRFTNTQTNEVFDYELPDDLLYCDSENYDEFILDYDSQTCYVNKKCAYNDDGDVILLDNEVVKEFDFPHIELTDGDYTVEILKYDEVPYGAFLFVRLMAQNMYTTQFATKAELNSEINQTAKEITSTVSETYETKANATTNYSKLTQTANSLQSQINSNDKDISTLTQTATSLQSQIKANDTDISNLNQTATNISSTVSKKVGYNEIISSINQSAEAVTINANKINLNGKKINLTSENITMSSDHLEIEKDGTMKITGARDSQALFRVSSDSNSLFTYVQPMGIGIVNSANGSRIDIAVQNENIYDSNIDVISSYGATSINGSGIRTPSLTVTGTKNRAVKMDDGSYVLLNAYETATPYFGDIGSNKTNENGYCKIEIETIFKQTIELEDYKIFIQECGEGKLYVNKKEEYFEVLGTPNLDFDWEIKAIQKGYATTRLAKYEQRLEEKENGEN